MKESISEIKKAEFDLFCKSAQQLTVTRMSTIEKELATPNTEDVMTEQWDPDSSVPWLLAIKAFEDIRVSTKATIGTEVCNNEDL